MVNVPPLEDAMDPFCLHRTALLLNFCYLATRFFQLFFFSSCDLFVVHKVPKAVDCLPPLTPAMREAFSLGLSGRGTPKCMMSKAHPEICQLLRIHVRGCVACAYSHVRVTSSRAGPFRWTPLT
jgi:hypothetical protein